jgi:DNA replicative helicase MCM subunit Mcm2 (Cdc46/Mcm family)
VQVRGNLVKQATPGDFVKIQGILLAHSRNTKYQNDLAFSPFLVASKITREKKKYVEMNINAQRIAEIE